MRAKSVPRTINAVMADLPPDQQEEIERRYQALRQVLPPPQRDKAPDNLPAGESTGSHLRRH